MEKQVDVSSLFSFPYPHFLTQNESSSCFCDVESFFFFFGRNPFRTRR